ncbi:MAG: polysaccharide biosynthesis tyrosine autokinase, partial [Prochlorothrix sp.]
LEIAFESPNGNQAKQAVDMLMEVYIQRNSELNRAEVVAARQFIEGQLPALEAQVQEATQALQAFKQRYNIVSLSSEAGAIAGRLTNLTQQIEELQTQAATAEARSQALRSQLNMDADKALALTIAIEDPGVQQILGNLQSTQTNLAVQQTLYTSAHPTVANLTRQVSALEALLQSRLDQVLQDSGQTLQISDLHLGSMEQGFAGELVQAEVERVSVSQQLQELITLRDQYTRRIQQIPELEVMQQKLQDEFELAQANYQRLRNRLPELVIAESQSMGVSRVEIIEEAVVPPKPPPGFQVLYVAAGGIVGVFGGLGLLIFLELIDRSVKTIRDAEAITGHLTLGAIAEFTTAAERNVNALLNDEVSPRLVVLRNPDSPICESYQMLSAALRLRGFGDRFHSLALVSAIGAEGRSEIVANLAATIAQGRRRVLILDADLRSPSQHLLWKVPNTQGLGDLLDTNTALNPDALAPFIQTLNPYLSLLPSGNLPVNPLALLDSQFMMDLVTHLGATYDLVIIDTPPLTRTPDAALLGQMVDGALWVVRSQFVDPSLMVVARALLLKSKTPVVGLAVNQVDFQVEAAAYAHFDRQHRENRGGLFETLLGGGGQPPQDDLLLINTESELEPESPLPGDNSIATADPIPPQPENFPEDWEGAASQGSDEPEDLLHPSSSLLQTAAARRARAREVASRRAARAAQQDPVPSPGSGDLTSTPPESADTTSSDPAPLHSPPDRSDPTQDLTPDSGQARNLNHLGNPSDPGHSDRSSPVNNPGNPGAFSDPRQVGHSNQADASIDSSKIDSSKIDSSNMSDSAIPLSPTDPPEQIHAPAWGNDRSATQLAPPLHTGYESIPQPSPLAPPVAQQVEPGLYPTSPEATQPTVPTPTGLLATIVSPQIPAPTPLDTTPNKPKNPDEEKPKADPAPRTDLSTSFGIAPSPNPDPDPGTALGTDPGTGTTHGTTPPAEVTEALAIHPELLQDLGVQDPGVGTLAPPSRSTRSTGPRTGPPLFQPLITWGKALMGTAQIWLQRCKTWVQRYLSRSQ